MNGAYISFKHLLSVKDVTNIIVNINPEVKQIMYPYEELSI